MKLLIALLLITSNAFAFTGTLTGTTFSGITDDFNRASLGSNWTALTPFSSVVITSNQIAGSATETASGWTAYTINNNQWVQATAVSLIADKGFSLCLRTTTSEFTGYYLNVGSNGWDIYKSVNNEGASLIDETVSIANGSLIKFTISGSLMTVYINGVARSVTATDSAIASGRPGISVTGVGITLDNFSAGDL